MYKLVLIRHGESTWNLENRFTGWTDVDLTPTGIEQAKNAGRLLESERYDFDVAYTSVLKRATRTLWHVLDEMDRTWLPVMHSWRLNERHYGALQGLNKAETAKKYGDEQVLVLCTLRQGEGALAPSARGMLERAELAQMSVVPLPPLTEAESIELLGQLVPGEIDPPTSIVRRALLRAGGGLPMLLELLVRDWMSHGDRCVALAVEAMTEEPGTAGGAGETYRRLLERLTLGLDSTTRSVLNLAAILGSQLNEFELYGLVDLTLAQAMAGLSHLASLRILRDGGLGLEFVNEVMRGEVYLAVPSSVRKVLHSKVADRLIERQRGGEEMLGLAIAWHCMRSKRVQEAGEWLIAGGREAIARSALAEAEAALESGYRHLPSSLRIPCGVLLAGVLVDQGQFLDAHTLACKIAGLSDNVSAPQVAMMLRLTALGVALSSSGAHDSTLAELIVLMEEASSSLDDRLRAATLAVRLTSLSLDTLHLVRVLDVLQRTSSDTSGSVTHRYDLMRAQVLFWLRRIPEAEDILTRLGDYPDRDGPALHRYNLELGLGACLAARGDYLNSSIRARTAAGLAARAGSALKEMAAKVNLSIGLFRLGQFEEARKQAAEARALGVDSDRSTTTAGAYGVELSCLGLSGRLEEFNVTLAKARHFAASDISRPIETMMRLWIADGLWLSGEEGDALEEASHGLRLATEPVLAHLGAICRWASVVHLRLPTPALEQLIRTAMDKATTADALDRLEVSLGALSALRLAAVQDEQLEIMAIDAFKVLPLPAINLIGRLGLPMRGISRLAQYPHPAA